MGLTLNEIYNGFQLVRSEPVEEINAQALMFEHQKSGAELLILECDDDNKTFSVTFRTPPENDCGVAHILEHSVLCGSRKYPVKEPFIELIKGSLQTFLNAMTFSDKTMYPVASRNEKDFYNLMDVYMDAVFYPRITKEIFLQEGWHHELDSPDGDIVIKGVVYNEMKGVFSSPENIIDRHLAHALFPKTTYGYESGGDPDAIPELTYEEFKSFHERHYHPSNSRIFIYGDGDTTGYLKFLDENFLSDFTRQERQSSIGMQRRFRAPKRQVIKYPIAKGESADQKTYVSMAMKLDRAVQPEHCFAMSILSHILLGTPASPLRKALLNSELGSEVIGGGFDDHRMETLFAVGLKGTEPEHEEKIMDIVRTTLRGLVESGIDEDMIRSSVNTIDFKLREANYGGFPKGLVYNLQALTSWLYDGDPLTHLRYEKLMAKIKRASRKGYFEKLIKKYLLDNKHQVIVVGVPQEDLGKRREARLRKRLRAFKKDLSPDEAKALVETTQTLQRLQTTPDRPEDLAKLPKLELDDINRSSQIFPIEVKREDAPKILFHDLFANQIAYTQIGFNCQCVPASRIQYLPLLGRMVIGMGTARRDYVAMSQQIGIHTGGVRANHYSSVSLADRENILSYIFFNGKSTIAKLGSLFDIYEELFCEYRFDDTRRLVEIIRSAKSDMEDSIIPSGNQYVLSRLQSYHSRLGRYDELTDGLSYFRFLETLLERAESDPRTVANEFRETAQMVFTRENALVNLTGEAKDYPKFEKRVNALLKRLPDLSHPKVQLELPTGETNEGFLTASTVQYVGKGINLYEGGFEYSGRFDVLKSVLSAGYLWDHVRVQGGAYGCSTSFDRYTGDFAFVSYRDPNLVETLGHYDNIADFIANLELSNDELTKLIIGCVGHLDPPLTPDRKGSISMVEHLTGMTPELKQRRRDELLATTVEGLRGYAPLFERLKTSGAVCVLGNEDKIRKAGKHFDHLVRVFH